ncbi:MAG: carotenoid oxygenase family protein [Persicimonas sp.]
MEINLKADHESNPYLNGSYAPIHEETTAHNLEVVGQLPEDLRGVYVRNGPNPRYQPEGRYHWFDGDGMLHGVRFRDGKATYRNRYVRTEAYRRESQAEESLWVGLMEPAKFNPQDMILKDTANTDVIYHNGGLLALWYLAGQPYKLDAETLETIGPEDFNGQLDIDVSAHAKVDEYTGEAFFFDQSFTPPYMAYGVADAEGNLAHSVPIELPGPRQPHDMAITENYSILMDLSLFADPEALAKGRYRVEFHEEIPSRFGIIPRYGGGDEIEWFDAEPCYLYHVVNAWEEDGEVVMIGCRAKNPQPESAEDTPLARMLAYLRLDAQLYEWRFDLETGQTSEGPLDDANTEFPTIRLGEMGRKTRYAYNVHMSSDDTLLFDGLFKYDLQKDTVDRYWFGENRWGSEASFAPRPGGDAEDDGYLVTFVHDERENQSEVVVLDARDIEAGPLARVKIPQRVPLGFHATWVPERKL